MSLNGSVGKFRARRFAFVPPRFGEKVAGGAETLVAELAARLAERGDEVHILTTCALDNRTWENYFPAGETRERGLKVLRFEVDPRNLDIWIPLQIRVADGLLLSVEEQLQWMENSVNSKALYAYIAAHSEEYDALFFAPYLFGTTFHGSLIAPERSYLIPCLHDEYYAYVDVVQSMFRQTAGCLFNAAPEMDLARSLYGKVSGAEVGMGFVAHDPMRVASLKPYFDEPWRYLVYVGRKETGKNVQALIDNFIEYKERFASSDLRLVVVGGGSFSDLHRPAALLRNDIVDLEHVSELDKQRIIRHALALCQPSNNESFSIVLMEAWLLGCPVLVSAGCPVTRQHALQSGGGLFFRDAADFALVLERLEHDSALCAAMAQAGLEYVKTQYSWPAVLDRFDSALQLTRA